MKKKNVLVVLSLLASTGLLLFQNFGYPSSKKILEYYYPPKDLASIDDIGSWATKTPEEGGFSSTGLDEVVNFLASGKANDDVPDYCGTNTTAFMILHKGKIIKEWYNPNFSKYFSLCKNSSGESGLPHDANWTTTSQGIIHSASKSMTSTLIGIALDQGKIKSLDEPVSNYLGFGWTCISKEKQPSGKFKYTAQEAALKENAITIRNLLTMTSGLAGSGQGAKGIYPYFVTEPGQVWFYNTNVYYQIINVLAAANGLNPQKPNCDLPRSQFDIPVADINTFAQSALFDRIGMMHSFYHGQQSAVGDQFKAVASSARDMARFGLLILSGGIWKNNGIEEHVLDPNNQYLLGALNSYEVLPPQVAATGFQNKAYGSLWWLNGQSDFMMSGPDFQECYVQQSNLAECSAQVGLLAPTAPLDMVSALGANDKKIYVVPSLDLVVVRHGGRALGASLAKSDFDNALWELIVKAKLTSAKITAQPKNQSIVKGEIAEFTVGADGNEAPTYQWYKNDVLVSGATKSVYSFKTINADNGARIKCVVSNSLRTVSSKEAVLTVLDPIPVITQQPLAMSVNRGTIAKFSIVAQGKSLTYQWYRDGAAIAGATLSTYSVKTTDADNGIRFKCKVSSTGGSVMSSNVKLTVLPPMPIIVTQPVPVTVKLGAVAKFSVVASGQDLKYQWYRNNTVISGATFSNYSLTTKITDDGVHIKCEVSNMGGKSSTNVVVLTVK